MTFWFSFPEPSFFLDRFRGFIVIKSGERQVETVISKSIRKKIAVFTICSHFFNQPGDEFMILFFGVLLIQNAVFTSLQANAAKTIMAVETLVDVLAVVAVHRKIGKLAVIEICALTGFIDELSPVRPIHIHTVFCLRGAHHVSVVFRVFQKKTVAAVFAVGDEVPCAVLHVDILVGPVIRVTSDMILKFFIQLL